jgi:hypothetical protein
VRKKEIALDTSTAAAAQQISIASATHPATAVAVVASVALLNGLTKEFIHRRESQITKLANDLCDAKTTAAIKKMHDEQFIQDLDYSVEKILKQRTNSKRTLMRNVFIGYIRTEHKSSYPLEKIYRVIENLTFADIATFKEILEATEIKKKYPIPWVSQAIMDNHNVSIEDQKKMMILHHTEDTQRLQSIANLEVEGILHETSQGIGGWGAGGGDTQYYVTQFGMYFKEYLLSTKLEEI